MSAAAAESDAASAVAELIGMSAEVRSCAIVSARGEVLAESSPNSWSEQIPRLWSALEGEPGSPACQVHVASEAGELFAVRAAGTTAVALTDRFALASLMFCDLRWVLRTLAGEGARGPVPREDRSGDV